VCFLICVWECYGHLSNTIRTWFCVCEYNALLWVKIHLYMCTRMQLMREKAGTGTKHMRRRMSACNLSAVSVAQDCNVQRVRALIRRDAHVPGAQDVARVACWA